MKIMEKVKSAKILQGYVKNPLLEVTLTALFSALFVITRPFQIPLVPGVPIAICASFLYITPLFVSWKYTWVLPLVVAYTGRTPLRNLIVCTAGTQTCYFASKFLPKGGRYQVLPSIIATFVANAVGSVYRHVMGIVPFAIGFPACMVKATATAATCVLIVPSILVVLKAMGVLDYGGDG